MYEKKGTHNIGSWQCCRCGSVHSVLVKSCPHCYMAKTIPITTTGGTITFPNGDKVTYNA
jgi:hypothetical protein